jgi:hypothetical protein
MHKTPGGVLTYTAGRDITRGTCAVDVWLMKQNGYCSRANSAWMVYNDTKIFLANRGLQHW